MRSPIRAHTSGLAQSTQLLMTQLHRSMGETVDQSRTIVFTDSRDDAARTSSGTELNHFRDLVRQLTRQVLQQKEDRIEIMRRGSADISSLEPEERALFDQIVADDVALSQAFLRQHLGAASHTDVERIKAFEATHGGPERYVSWGSLIHRLSRELLAIGVNPAGPDASFRTISGSDVPWYRAWEPPNTGLWHKIDADIARQAQQLQTERLTVKVSEAAFDRAGRDLESIGLGIIEPAAASTSSWPLDDQTATQVVRSVTRILGASGRYDGSYYRYANSSPPKNVKDYLAAVAAGRCDENTLIEHVSTTFGSQHRSRLDLNHESRPICLAGSQSRLILAVGLRKLFTRSSPPLSRCMFGYRLQRRWPDRARDHTRRLGLLCMARKLASAPTASS